MRRIFMTEDPFLDLARPGWFKHGEWPAHWIDHPQRPLGEPSVALFRRQFTLAERATIRIHVSADNRYRLLLDGQQVGRGPERGDPRHWRYESFELELEAGEHTFLAQNWWLADKAPYAQMTVRPGFLLAAEGEFEPLLSTGIAPWEAALFPGIACIPPGMAWLAGDKIRVDGKAYPWGWESGAVSNWTPAEPIAHGFSAEHMNEFTQHWLLTPATLPPMREDRVQAGRVRYLADGATPYPVTTTRHLANEAASWQGWLAGQSTVTIPPHATRTAVIDLENYYCVYPHFTVSGGQGAHIRINWAEGLFTDAVELDFGNKGHRDEIDGKYFYGRVGDEFLPDGGEQREFTTLWWEAGRYLEFTITTADEPLTLEAFALYETGYPLEMEGSFDSTDARLQEVIPLALRAMQMCSHETYMDCPYYEQLMYVGDTRLEVLTTYALTHDDRLPRKALTAFNDSRRPSGLTESRFPNKCTQMIPPFSLWWVGMAHDFWRWRDDPQFVRSLMPGVRGVMEAFRALIGADGLMAAPNGWNFTDWVPEWKAGIPPQAQMRPSGVLNLHFAMILRMKAEMEAYFGEEHLAARDRDTAMQVMDAVRRNFWVEARGLFADDLDHAHFSEHAQCLAILSELLPDDVHSRVVDGLFTAPDLARTTIYFTHYLFETCYRLGRADTFFARLGLWFDLQKYGFKTTFEQPEPSRSDCHAWGAHPLYHYYASILGIRPAAPGFARVRIAPLLGELSWAKGTLPHPAGEISVALNETDDTLQVEITLPATVSGTFVWHEQEIALQPGENQFTLRGLAVAQRQS